MNWSSFYNTLRKNIICTQNIQMQFPKLFSEIIPRLKNDILFTKAQTVCQLYLLIKVVFAHNENFSFGKTICFYECFLHGRIDIIKLR